MIQTVEFRNFKGLRDVRVGLERFTALVGPNASGKTSILDGLAFLVRSGASRQVDWARYGVDPSLLFSRGAEGEMALTCTLNDLPLAPELSLKVLVSRQNRGLVLRFLHQQSRRAAWLGIHEMPPVQESLPAVSFLRLDARRLAEPSYSPHAEPTLGHEGEGLSSALAYLALNQPDRFRQLQDLLRAVVPYVERLRFARVPVQRADPARGTQTYWGEQVVFDMAGAPNIPAHLASDGTLIVLGLLTALLRAEGAHLLLLDDLDHGLHPKAQKDLVALLRSLLEQKPDLQIMATTHSPYLLDHLRPEEVRLTTRRDDGSVACARLDEHPDFERWKEAMTPGEFWSLVGEKWVAQRQPQEVGA
jgi:predicted ATPase